MAGKLILIGGLSRSGKSTLAQQLASQLENSAYLEQDFFVKPEEELPIIKDRIDWDHPDSVDWKSWTAAIHSHKANYDWVIAEGIFAFTKKSINDLAHFTIQLSIEKELFHKERSQEIRWGKEPEWFLAHVWESHQKYQDTNQINLDLEISRNQIPSIPVIIESIIKK